MWNYDDLKAKTKAGKASHLPSKKPTIDGTLAVVNIESSTLANKTQRAVAAKLSVADASTISVDTDAIQRRLEGCFWSGVRNKMSLLNKADELIQSRDDHFLARSLVETFGPILDLLQITKRAYADHNSSTESARTRAEKLVADCNRIAERVTLDYIKIYSQREFLEIRVDMFAQKASIKFSDEVACVAFPHLQLSSPDVEPDERDITVADYKEHFPLLDRLLEMLAAARFAPDRKLAYLWLRCESDWGKGFLLGQGGVLAGLGLTVEISAEEVESMLNGKPSGKGMRDFKRVFALVVDEFKHVKSELKQLQNTVTFAPKFQMQMKAEIYAKIFMSAEDVPSLAGDFGMEDQFANRFSYIAADGRLPDRARFNEIGMAAYLRHIQSYVAERLNRLISDYRASGRHDSELEASRVLAAFHLQHGIDRSFDRFSRSLDSMAEEIIVWLVDLYTTSICHDVNANSIHVRMIEVENEWYLAYPAARIEQWIDENAGRSEVRALKRKKAEIYERISSDGKGNFNHRIGERGQDGKRNGRKCVKLKLTEGQADRLARAKK